MSSVLVDKCKNAIGKVICKDFEQSGSGFFADKQGLFLTNNHVITKKIFTAEGTIIIDYSKEIFVKTDEAIYPASIVIDENADQPAVYDYAILKVDGAPCTHIDIGDFSQIRQGESVIAMGYPSGFNLPIATSGMVSAILSKPSHINSLHKMQSLSGGRLCYVRQFWRSPNKVVRWNGCWDGYHASRDKR